MISAICGRFLRGNRPRGHDSYPLGLDLLKEPATHNANRFLVKGESATYSTFHDIKGVGRVCEEANPGSRPPRAHHPPAKCYLAYRWRMVRPICQFGGINHTPEPPILV